MGTMSLSELEQKHKEKIKLERKGRIKIDSAIYALRVISESDPNEVIKNLSYGRFGDYKNVLKILKKLKMKGFIEKITTQDNNGNKVYMYKPTRRGLIALKLFDNW